MAEKCDGILESNDEREGLLSLTIPFLAIEFRSEEGPKIVKLALRIIVSICEYVIKLTGDADFEVEEYLSSRALLKIMETYKKDIDVSTSVLQTFNR